MYKASLDTVRLCLSVFFFSIDTVRLCLSVFFSLYIAHDAFMYLNYESIRLSIYEVMHR